MRPIACNFKINMAIEIDYIDTYGLHRRNGIEKTKQNKTKTAHRLTQRIIAHKFHHENNNIDFTSVVSFFSKSECSTMFALV